MIFFRFSAARFLARRDFLNEAEAFPAARILVDESVAAFGYLPARVGSMGVLEDMLVPAAAM